MRAMLLLLALTASPAPTPTTAREHGVSVPAPEGWTATKEGSTWVFSAPTSNAVLRVDLFQKEKAGDPRDCVGQIVEKLAAADRVAKETFTPMTVDGQPAALQTTVDKRRQKQRRVVGCNGKSYFLIDWLDVGASAKHEDAFAALLTQIRFEAFAESAKPAAKPRPAKKEAGSESADPLAPLDPSTGSGKAGSKQ
ncbi:MAG TPA: hypothetical protein VGK67_40300 [Myxococcales bacterium]|jgi:predicted Zn-dependent protease